jgi:hypothetical protein
LRSQPVMFNSLEEALNEMGKRLRLPLPRWIKRSEILRWLKTQTRLTRFLSV